MTKPLLDNFRMDALFEHDGSVGVACIVEAETVQPTLADQFDPGMGYAVW